MKEEPSALVETAKQRARLKWYEDQIENSISNVGTLFRQLAADPLKPHLLEYDSLEEYCAVRWNISAQRMRQIRSAEDAKATIIAFLGTGNPETAETVSKLKEGQIREVASLPVEQQVEVIKAAASDGKITQGKIQKAKARIIKPKPEDIQDAEFTDKPQDMQQKVAAAQIKATTPPTSEVELDEPFPIVLQKPCDHWIRASNIEKKSNAQVARADFKYCPECGVGLETPEELY